MRGPAVGERHLHCLAGPMCHRGRHGRQRGHPRRQHLAAQQRVHQRALAPLGLAHDQHSQPRRPEPLPQRRQHSGVGFIGQPGQFVKRRRQRVGQFGCAHTASYLFRQGPLAAMPQFDGGPLRRRLSLRLTRPRRPWRPAAAPGALPAAANAARGAHFPAPSTPFSRPSRAPPFAKRGSILPSIARRSHRQAGPNVYASPRQAI